MMTYNGGAVYNHYLAKQMDFPTEDLRKVIQKWNEKSLAGKVISCFNPFVDYELKSKVARDLLDARENPQGEIAQKINWKLDAYRTKK